jgi:hypothetical protein
MFLRLCLHIEQKAKTVYAYDVWSFEMMLHETGVIYNLYHTQDLYGNDLLVPGRRSTGVRGQRAFSEYF